MDDFAARMQDKRADRVVHRFKLVRLVGDDAVTPVGTNASITSAVDLQDYLIFTYPEQSPDTMIRALRRHLIERFGPNVIVLPESIKICVFERVEEPST